MIQNLIGLTRSQLQTTVPPPLGPNGCEGVGVCDPVPFKTLSNSDGAREEGGGRGSEAAEGVLVHAEQAS